MAALQLLQCGSRSAIRKIKQTRYELRRIIIIPAFVEMFYSEVLLGRAVA